MPGGSWSRASLCRAEKSSSAERSAGGMACLPVAASVWSPAPKCLHCRGASHRSHDRGATRLMQHMMPHGSYHVRSATPTLPVAWAAMAAIIAAADR